MGVDPPPLIADMSAKKSIFFNDLPNTFNTPHVINSIYVKLKCSTCFCAAENIFDFIKKIFLGWKELGNY